jgi:asparagine synthetase B (glutamine-hydrolysing)
VTDDWLADLLLFPDMPGHRTEFGPIRRVAHGQTIEIDPNSGRFRPVFQERLVPQGETGQKEAPERVLEALDRALALFSDRPDKAVLFSGGVDSTLLKWRLGDSSEAVFAGCDSPEFRFEREYAEQSARELKIRPRKIEIQESDLRNLSLDALEETAQVFPVTVYQPVFNSRAFRSASRLFFSGDYADTLFGFSAVKQVYEPETEKQAEGACRPAEDPEGFAAKTYSTSDDLLAERILGSKAVERAFERRLAYVLERFCFRSPEMEIRNRQAELCSFMVFFSGDWFNRYRQQAFSLGKSLHAPFSQRTVVEESLKIPLPYRYILDGHLKHLLKGILLKNLPGCPALGKKGGSGWPRTRLCTSGPFAGFFSRNPVPEFIPAREKQRLENPDWDSSTVTLTCLFLSEWERMFLKKKPGPVPGTREIRLGPEGGTAA